MEKLLAVTSIDITLKLHSFLKQSIDGIINELVATTSIDITVKPHSFLKHSTDGIVNKVRMFCQ